MTTDPHASPVTHETGMQTQMAELSQQLAAMSSNLGSATSSRRPKGEAPSVEEFLPEVLSRLTNERTRTGYGRSLQRLISARPCLAPGPNGEPVDPARCAAAGCQLDDHGTHRDGHDEVGAPYRVDGYPITRLRHIMVWIQHKEIAKAEQTLRRRIFNQRRAREPELTLAAIDISGHVLPPGLGASGVRSFVDAVNNFFAVVVEYGWLDETPTVSLREHQPAKPSTRRRALQIHELQQIEQVVMLHASDPDLDLLIIWFGLETGARISEVFKLLLEDIDPERQTLWLGKKGDFEREHPISSKLLLALLRHASDRGAYYDSDHVFYMRDEKKPGQYKPVTSGHTQNLWTGIRKHCHFAGKIQVSNHTLRKSVATLLERRTGERVAEAFIGHFHRSASNTPYLRADLAERALALEVLTGQPHPLAAANAYWLSPEQAGELAQRRLAAYGTR